MQGRSSANGGAGRPRAGHDGNMENFSALFGAAEPPPAAAAALGFGPAKAPGAGAAPPPAASAAAPPPGEDAARKAAAGPFYLLRELPGAGGPRGGAGAGLGQSARRNAASEGTDGTMSQ